MVLPTEDLMPTSTSLHPTNRPGAGMTKGDTVPPPPAPPGSLYVVTSYIWDDQYWLEGLRPPEVYATAAAANAAARRLMVRHAELLDEIGGDVDEAFDFEHNPDQECGDVGLYNGRLAWKKAHEAAVVRVFCVEGSEVIAGAAAAGGETTRGKRARGTAGGGGGGGRVKSEQVSDDDGGDNDDEKEEGEEEDTKPAAKRPRRLASGSKAAATSSASASGKGKGKGKAAAAAVPKTAVQAATYRKQIPEGKPNCLRGLKLLFTGTFETMDRRTSLATAARYGAEVVTKLEETDYVVVGLRAGPKKLREINEKELETISEEEFFHILEHGVSPEKRKRMAARRRAEEEEGGEGEESEDGEEKKAGRTRWKRARR